MMPGMRSNRALRRLSRIGTPPRMPGAMRPMPWAASLLAGGLFVAAALCTSRAESPAEAPSPSRISRLDVAAESYVRLVLALAEHWPDYLDSYHGPEAWKAEARAAARPLDEIHRDANGLATQLRAVEVPPGDETNGLRRHYLVRHAEALAAAIEFHRGARRTFDEESKALFDAVAPRLREGDFQEALAELDRLLPGEGGVHERNRAYMQRFVVPADRVEAVYRAALDEARRRTLQHIDLPEDERVDLELVENEDPGIYHSYKGHHRSVLELNVLQQPTIDQVAFDAAHEGYPGHHVQAVLIDTEFLERNQWVEHSTLVVFSPFALIVEGAGNFAHEVAFPDRADEARFLAEVLFPLAGFDPADAPLLMAVREQKSRLGYAAATEAARRYFDGELDRQGAIQWLVDYGLWSANGAESALEFLEVVRAFVINYSVGHRLVREHVEARGGTRDRPDRRWQEFDRLLRSPLVASTLETRNGSP
jgi:hypothetical protein